MSDDENYYLAMLNVMAGLRDDLDANGAPSEAKELLQELMEVCKSDYRIRFRAQNNE
jgi:hypothetical protein